MKQLEGKVTLITGASRGIGAAAARRFAQEGATVYAAARTVEATAAWVKDQGLQQEVIPVFLDVTDSAAIKQTIQMIKKQSGRLDVLVNNAAIERNEAIGMITKDSMQSMFETNVFALVELLQIAARLMQRQGGGSIINVSSRVGERGGAGQLVYSATKGAVISVSRSAAKELAQFGIRVNAVSPGLTDTEMLRTVPKEKMCRRLESICMGCPAQPEEIADAMIFLASDASRFVSGQVLNVDGCTII